MSGPCVCSSEAPAPVVKCGNAGALRGVDGAVRRTARRAAAAGAHHLHRLRPADPVRVDGHGLAGEAVAGRPRCRRNPGRGRRTGRRAAPRRTSACRGCGRAVHLHRRRARLDGVHDQPLPLRPGVVEHPGRLHQRLAAGPAEPVPERLRAGARTSGDGPPRARVQIRARRSRLPQALLGHPPRGPRRLAATDRRRPGGGDGRHLQRAQHQPHQRGDHDPKLRARQRIST
ncbi:hypothetical protein I552_6662 [Mycobacterium xenopi 3993]|nr:hypothetical protein I552_6662 [Mycobacterium xenopi 3993]